MAEERRMDDQQSEELKAEAREYADEEGKVHQHAKKYMEDNDMDDGSNE